MSGSSASETIIATTVYVVDTSDSVGGIPDLPHPLLRLYSLRLTLMRAFMRNGDQ